MNWLQMPNCRWTDLVTVHTENSNAGRCWTGSFDVLISNEVADTFSIFIHKIDETKEEDRFYLEIKLDCTDLICVPKFSFAP